MIYVCVCVHVHACFVLVHVWSCMCMCSLVCYPVLPACHELALYFHSRIAGPTASDYMCVRADHRAERKVNERKARHSLFHLWHIVGISTQNALTANSCNQEARSFLVQFVACAAHHKCYKRAALSPPLNDTCKPCFEKLKSTGSLQHWRWLSNPHSNAYLSGEEATVSSVHPWLAFQTNTFGDHITCHSVAVSSCSFEWTSNILGENVTRLSELSYCYQTHFVGVLVGVGTRLLLPCQLL